MDLNDIESESSSFSIISIVHRSDDRFLETTRRRYRKSSHKRTKITSPLVIDHLNSLFRSPGDSVQRMRTCRNWHPEFLIKFLRDFKQECNVQLQCDKRIKMKNFVLQTPKIFSISSGAKSSYELNDDTSSTRNMMKNLRRRLNIVRKEQRQCISNRFSESTIICKYWIARFIARSILPTAILSEENVNYRNIHCQTRSIDSIESIETAEPALTQKNDHCSQLYEHTKEEDNIDILDNLRNKSAENNSSFKLKSDSFSIREDHTSEKSNKPCVIKKDTQVQISSRKISRRKQLRKKRSKLMDEEQISHNKHHTELMLRTSSPKTVCNFSVDSYYNSHKKRNNENSRRIQNNRAEYLNKLTAVNRQIEEITATLRETCYNDVNARDILSKCDRSFSPISDEIEVNDTKQKRRFNNNEDNSIFPENKRDNKREGKHYSTDFQEIRESDSERNKNVSITENLYSSDINNTSPFLFDRKYPIDDIATSMNPDDNLDINNIFLRDSKRIPRNKTEARYHRVKQISFNLNLIKTNGMEEFSIQDESSSFNEINREDNLVDKDDGRYLKYDLIEDTSNSEKSKYRRKILEQRAGEMTILNDIKKRIDRDFDDPSSLNDKNETAASINIYRENCENDKLSLCETSRTVGTMIEQLESASLNTSESLNSDSTDIRIGNSTSIEAMSVDSNKSSTTATKYFSCTRFPSLASLGENEDLAYEEQNRINARDYLYSGLHSYGNRSNLNLTSNTDCCNFSLPSIEYASCNRSMIETINESNDILGISADRENLSVKNVNDESQIDSERHYTEDCITENSKSSRYIGSIDSGVFLSSSPIEPNPRESSYDDDRSQLTEKCRVRKTKAAMADGDFSSDNSCTDNSLNRKVDNVVRDLTKNLILYEKRVRMKLEEIRRAELSCSHDSRYTTSSHNLKADDDIYERAYNFFASCRWSSEDENITSISTPSVLSLSDSD